jgi:hypothetical protein
MNEQHEKTEKAETRALMRRADDGDEEARAELCRRMDHAQPAKLEEIGCLARRAEDALLHAANRDFVSYEAARRCLEEKRRDLAGPNPTALERALADRLAFALAEADYLAAWRARGGEMSIKQSEHLERRYSAAHARAMSAARTLATVRRLLPGAPTVAVGVQVNMGHTGASSNVTEGRIRGSEYVTSTPLPAHARARVAGESDGKPDALRRRERSES